MRPTPPPPPSGRSPSPAPQGWIGHTEIANALQATMGPPILIAGALKQASLRLARYTAKVNLVQRVRVADFNKGIAARIDDGDGFPTFAELLVAKRLRTAGWAATWASAYRRKFVAAWNWDELQPSISDPLPDCVLDTLRAVSSKRNSITSKRRDVFGGLPDVVAWRGPKIIFLECKAVASRQLKPNGFKRRS